MCRVGEELEKEDVVFTAKAPHLGCDVRTVSVDDEKDGFSGRISRFCLRNERVAEPLEAEKVVCPAVW